MRDTYIHYKGQVWSSNNNYYLILKTPEYPYEDIDIVIIKGTPWVPDDYIEINIIDDGLKRYVFPGSIGSIHKSKIGTYHSNIDPSIMNMIEEWLIDIHKTISKLGLSNMEMIEVKKDTTQIISAPEASSPPKYTRRDPYYWNDPNNMQSFVDRYVELKKLDNMNGILEEYGITLHTAKTYYTQFRRKLGISTMRVVRDNNDQYMIEYLEYYRDKGALMATAKYGMANIDEATRRYEKWKHILNTDSNSNSMTG